MPTTPLATSGCGDDRRRRANSQQATPDTCEEFRRSLVLCERAISGRCVASSKACDGQRQRLEDCLAKLHALHSGIGTAAPLVVCHGGPGVPSDYLFDLSKVGNRAVVFYDQLGAGRSDSPPLDAQTADEYCPAGFVRHLDAVLSALGLARFHLYGQSWGGILAFEYVRAACLTSSKSMQQLPLPLSLTLSNTPSSVALVEAEAARLLDACGGDPNAFSLAHTCRVVPPPALLADAYAHAGTVWRGTAAISGWEADLSQLDRKRWPLHTLLMTAEADFVTPACMRAWETLPGCRTVQIAGASHHALLEEPEQYFRLLVEHLEECD